MKKQSVFVSRDKKPVSVDGEVFEICGIKFFLYKDRNWNVFDYKTGLRLLGYCGTKRQANETIVSYFGDKTKEKFLKQLSEAWKVYPSLNN